MVVWQERTDMLLGSEGLRRLSLSHIAVVGCGGVGAFAAEMLARAGVTRLTLVDSDVVSESNINRQLPALHSTVGRPKTEVLRERILDINPSAEVVIIPEFINESNIPSLFGGGFDFVVDAIDTLSPKIALIRWCLDSGIPMVSSMGSGAKMDMTRIRICDISKTRMCPLAYMVRKRLHKVGIRKGFPAVFSEEEPRHESMVIEESANKKSQVGSVSYMPAAFGCACAQAAIVALTKTESDKL